MKGILTPCIEYKGAHNRDGYAKSGGKLIHRLTYVASGGVLIPGMHLDHLCGNRGCVNPTHLEQVTPRVNIMRSQGVAAKNIKKTHCPHGHEYTPANTRYYKTWRWCKECDRQSSRKYSKRKQQEKNL